jgi:hypothetical protein
MDEGGAAETVVPASGWGRETTPTSAIANEGNLKVQ